MNPAIERRRTWQESLGAPPPRAVVTAVKVSAIGTLVLPVFTTVLLIVLSALDAPGFYGGIAAGVSALAWVAMFACAQVLTARYPRVPTAR